MNDNLQDIVTSIDLSRAVVRRIKYNFVFFGKFRGLIRTILSIKMAKEKFDRAEINDEVGDNDNYISDHDGDNDGFFSDPLVLYSTIAIGVILLILCVIAGLYFYNKKVKKIQKEMEMVNDLENDKTEKEDQSTENQNEPEIVNTVNV